MEWEEMFHLSCCWLTITNLGLQTNTTAGQGCWQSSTRIRCWHRLLHLLYSAQCVVCIRQCALLHHRFIRNIQYCYKLYSSSLNTSMYVSIYNIHILYICIYNYVEVLCACIYLHIYRFTYRQCCMFIYVCQYRLILRAAEIPLRR